MTEKRKNAIVEFQDVVKTYGEGEALQYAVNHVMMDINIGDTIYWHNTWYQAKVGCIYRSKQQTGNEGRI